MKCKFKFVQIIVPGHWMEPQWVMSFYIEKKHVNSFFFTINKITLNNGFFYNYWTKTAEILSKHPQGV